MRGKPVAHIQLAVPAGDAAGSPGMARPKRTPGTTNAPGGEWYSTPDEKRVNKPRRFTLTPRAEAALLFLAPDEGQRSAAVCDALEALARSKGWSPPADEPKATK